MPGQDGRSACANFQPCPRSNGRGQSVMRIKQAKVLWFGNLRRHRAVGNPDAFMVEVHLARPTMAGGLLGTSAGEKGPMEKSHLHFSGVVGDGGREEARILVIHMHEIDAVIRLKG